MQQMPLITALSSNREMRKIAGITILVVSSIAILASALIIMTIALTQYSEVPYLSLIFSSSSPWPTLFSAAIGAAVAYVLVTRNEKRKEADFEQRVKYTIKFELNNYYEVLNYGLKIGKLRTDRNDTLGVDQKSELVDKWRALDVQNPVYSKIGIDTKLKTLDASLRTNLDNIYQEIMMHGVHMYFQDNTTEVYFAISKTSAEKLKQIIKDAMQSLD